LRLVTDPALVETVRRILLERHHVLGQKNFPQLTIILCRNHHAIVTEFQRRGAVPMTLQTNPLDRQIASLGNVSALLQGMLEAVEEFRTDLEEFREFLDDRFPNWSDLWKEWK